MQPIAMVSAETIYEEIVNKISEIEEKINIPRNKYLKSIKDELESRKQSISDLISNQTSFCNEVITEVYNSFASIISEASEKICKGKKKATKCISRNLYNDIIPKLESINEKLLLDSDEDSFLDICQDSSSPLGCLVNDEQFKDIPAINNTQVIGCANEIINIDDSNLTQSSTAMINSLLDLGEVQSLKYSTDKGDIYLLKNTSFIPLEVMISLDEQTNVSGDIPPVVVILPKSQKYGFKVCITNSSDPWSYNYSYKTAIGLSTDTHTGDSKYFLPYKAGETYEVTQGEMGTFSHFEEFLYSIDFDFTEGTEFTAMRDGIVVFVKEDSNEGGPDKSLTDKANFIWVLHNDGSIGRYVHLQQNGALVNVGDKIKAKDVLGLSGNTGFTSGPHLHVQVVLPKGFEDEEKIPILFSGIDGALDEDASYTAFPLCK